MHREHALAGGEPKLDECGSDVPVVPLTPGDGLRRIEGGFDCERPGGRLAVDVDGDGSAAILGVEQVGCV